MGHCVRHDLADPYPPVPVGAEVDRAAIESVRQLQDSAMCVPLALSLFKPCCPETCMYLVNNGVLQQGEHVEPSESTQIEQTIAPGVEKRRQLLTGLVHGVAADRLKEQMGDGLKALLPHLRHVPRTELDDRVRLIPHQSAGYFKRGVVFDPSPTARLVLGLSSVKAALLLGSL